MEKIDSAACSWILSDWWYALTVRSACARMGVCPEEIRDDLARFGWDKISWDKPLDKDGRTRFKKFLSTPEVQTKIIEALHSTFEQTAGYLKQEGAADENQLAIVDIGWKGKPQAALNRILVRAKILPPAGITGFYFGLAEEQEIVPGDKMHGFLFNLAKSLRHCALRNNHLYEAFAAAPEPKISHFKNEGGRFVPVFRPDNPAPERWGVRLQQQAILAFAEGLARRYDFRKLKEQESAQALNKILGMFINDPTPAEAETYGKFPMDGEMTESRIAEIAPAVSRRKFWSLCRDLKHFNLFWVQASLRRSGLRFENALWKIVLPILEYGLYSCAILKSKWRMSRKVKL